MFKLLKGGHCYTPDYIGIKDILIVKDIIYKIEDEISIKDFYETSIIDCRGKIVCPGFIDQHVHITGGGGESGPSSRIPELMLGDIISSGVTTLVGVLGFDGITRNISGLLAKARALRDEGITSYIYTGSYGVPTTTLTGKVSSDIVLLNEVIGVGEIAISDHRSSHPSLTMLKEIAYEARMGGLLSGKAGIVHLHIGDGKTGLTPIIELLDKSEFPPIMFIPTHVNRNRKLFNQAIEYCKDNRYIDLTAGDPGEKGVSVPNALSELRGITGLNNVTVSSDGNGSIPSDGNNKEGVGKMEQLFKDIKLSIYEKKIDISEVLKIVTSNVAKVLKMYPAKGVIKEGSDADILVLSKEDFYLEKVIALGKLMIDNGNILVKGEFEK